MRAPRVLIDAGIMTGTEKEEGRKRFGEFCDAQPASFPVVESPIPVGRAHGLDGAADGVYPHGFNGS